MEAGLSERLLESRWARGQAIVREHGQDPDTQLSRVGLIVYARVLGAPWGELAQRQEYQFRLDYADYDEHAPTVLLCDPVTKVIGGPFQYYPLLDGNSTFNHGAFFCMPGDRRAYEAGNHKEWQRKEYYHLDEVLMHLFGLLNCAQYRGPRP